MQNERRPLLAGKANGCKNFERETLIKHLQSWSHVYCKDCFLIGSSKSKAATQQQEVLSEALARQEAVRQKELQWDLAVKFNIAYILQKEELPFTKYRPLLLLCKMNGVGHPYDNDVKCTEFISAIWDSIKSDLGDLMESVKYASIMK